MDEYRNSQHTYSRPTPHPPPVPPPPHMHHVPPRHSTMPPMPPPPPETAPPPESAGLLGNLGGLSEHLPLILMGLGGLGVYLWLQKQEGGIGDVLGGLLKRG